MTDQRAGSEAEAYWSALHVLRHGTATEGVEAAHALIKLALHGSERVSRLARIALVGQGLLVRNDAPATAYTWADGGVIHME